MAGSGAVAAGALIGANVITNTVAAEISGSTVESGSTLNLAAENKSSILGLHRRCGSIGGGSWTPVAVGQCHCQHDPGGDCERAAGHVDATGAVTLSAKDTSTIDALAFGVSGSGGAALGAAVAANVITNKVETAIVGSILDTGSTLSLDSESSAIIRTLVIGVSGSGGFAVQVTAVGNVIANTVTASISDSTVTAAGDVTLTASDIAPSAIPDWLVPDNKKSTLNDAKKDSPVTDLSKTNILSVVVGVAGSGLGAVNVTLVGNSITNTVQADILDSNVTSTAGKVDLNALSSAAIISLTAGVAFSGGVAVNATGTGNVIHNKVEAAIRGGSTVTAHGPVDLDAIDQSRVTAIGLSFAGSGGLALNAIIGANVILNTVAAEISGSTVDTDSSLVLSAENKSTIFGFSGGVAVGSAAGLISLSANIIENTTRAGILSGSDVDADGSITLSAKDSSSVDAFSFGVSGGAASAGMALALNEIRNTVWTGITGSTVDTASTLSMTSESSAIIRMLTIGVSASGFFAANVSVVGNLVMNTVKAEIVNSTVRAAGDVTLWASDIAPSVIPGLSVPADKQAQYDDAMGNKPAGLSLSANILALMINVAGSGGVGANISVMGNKIQNVVQSHISGSTVLAGVVPKAGYNEADGIDSSDYTISTGTDVSLNAVSSARIIAVSAGIALGGLGAVDATTNGNFIANTVTTGIENGSKVHAGGKVGLSASDSSNITALGLSFSGSGGIAGAVVFAKNDIGNTISSRIAGSTILTGSDLTLDALSNASILSFVGGVAVSGLASVTLSLTINDIHNTVQASILNSGAPSYVSSGIPNASGTGEIDLTATDTSKIDSIAIGLSGSLLGAARCGYRQNFIGTQTTASIEGSTAISDSTVSVSARSTAIIRSFAAGIAGAGFASGQRVVDLQRYREHRGGQDLRLHGHGRLGP